MIEQLILEAMKKDEVIDVEGDVGVEMLEDFVKDGRLVIRFGHVKGDFCCNNLGLTTLEGCPERVSGSFACDCNQLIDLVGGPKTVGKFYDCSSNKLTSLKGAPKGSADFWCTSNQITSLDGIGAVDGSVWCSNNPLMTQPIKRPRDLTGKIRWDSGRG